MAGNTHLVLYDNTSGYVHAVWLLTAVGSWLNSATYQADGFVNCSTQGKVATDLGANIRCVAMNGPTFDQTNYAGFGALEVDVPGAPTDTQERTDGDRIPSDQGGRDGDDPDYTYAA